jgi:protein-tyrosine phosphatase
MALTISSLTVAGGMLGLCPMPGRNGDYPGDFQAVLAWKPALVLTLTPLDELATKAAATLPADLAREGVNWRHFPVADYGTPAPDQAADWQPIATQTIEKLQKNNRVLIHCMGGCGRSGMAALRLMIMAGEAPAAALVRLRAARPCAVETPEQQAWAVNTG